MGSERDKLTESQGKDKPDELVKEGRKSELTSAFEQMSQEENLGKSIEQILDKAVDLNEAQAGIVLAVKDHLKAKKKSGVSADKVDELEKKITEDIAEFVEKISDDDMDPDLGTVSKKNKANLLTIESRKNLKRIMKNFVIYEIYKVMNPKRIAGETTKDNYLHNLVQGGEKLASKYEGGRESDLKQYGSDEVSRIKSQAAAVSKGGGIGR